MVHTIWQKLAVFRREARGVVLVLTALLILPFIILLGVAVDVGRLLIVKNQLIAAIDAAALSAARKPGFDDAQAQAMVQSFINANFSSQNHISVTNLTVNRTNNNMQVDVTATATVNTYFVELIGYNTLSTTIHSRALGAQNHLEVVLVLDNTGSMNNTYGGSRGIDGLKNAATTLVTTLFDNDLTGTNVKIGIVPFTDTVNVGTRYINATWIDNSNSAGSMSQENIDVPTGTGLVTFASNLASAAGKPSWAWAGCVRQRIEPFDVQDVAPSTGNPATLFTPFFAPDEPDKDSSPASRTSPCGRGSNFYNSYLCDKSCWQTGQQADQKCIAKYTPSPEIQNSDNGPNNLCTSQPIIRLSNNRSAIQNEIDAMTADGATVIPVGLMWGWHLLSPNGPFADGVSYSDVTTIKVIILVTDGENNVQLSGNSPTGPTNGFDKSIYTAYGYGSGPHLNLLPLPTALNGVRDQPDYNLDQKLITLCNNIKAVTDAGGNTGRIQIYTIGFGNSINSNALQLLQQCASNPSYYYYNPTGEELEITFRNIALGLNKLRLSQ